MSTAPTLAEIRPIVLVIDDDAEIRQLLIEILEMSHFDAQGAANGAEALQLLGAEHVLPCVILLDMMMPVMNGWEFRRAQLLDPRLGQVPVIIVSGVLGAEDVAVALGAAGAISKPVDIDLLLGTAARFCRARTPLLWEQKGADPP